MTAGGSQRLSFEISTPQVLIGSIALTVVVAALFIAFSIYAVREQRVELQDIAYHSAKNVIAAEQLAVALADMDANVVNVLLVPGQRQASIDEYLKSRKMMSDALVDVAENATGSAEDDLLRGLAASTEEYVARIQAAFTVQGANAALNQYLKAADLLDKTLLPGAASLDKVNRESLNRSYDSVKRAGMVGRTLVWFFGLFLLGVLIAIQMFLSERMRRTLNPLVLAGSLLAGGLLLYTNHALSTASHQMDVLKNDAFDSIHILLQAKTVAYEANSRESRYLLDRAGASVHMKAFTDLTAKVASDPRKLRIQANKSRGHPPADLKGFLPDELRNITFEAAGERDATVSAVEWWSRYIDIDDTIRTLEASGQHDKAIALCVGINEGESNWAFNHFVEALDKTIKINRTEFDKAVDRGEQALERYELTSSVIAALVTLACLLGLRPRIREYSI